MCQFYLKKTKDLYVNPKVTKLLKDPSPSPETISNVAYKKAIKKEKIKKEVKENKSENKEKAKIMVANFHKLDLKLAKEIVLNKEICDQESSFRSRLDNKRRNRVNSQPQFSIHNKMNKIFRKTEYSKSKDKSIVRDILINVVST